jgi:DNA-binding response OmpR family regulator
VLLHKITAVLQRSTQIRSKETTAQTFGSYTFNPVERTLSSSEGTVRLSPREAELLNMLLANRDVVLDRSTILNTIWGDDSYFNNRSLDVYITKLRKRFNGDKRVVIESLYGSGVKMTS